MDFEKVERWYLHEEIRNTPVVDATAFDALLLAYKEKRTELVDLERLVSELKDPNCS